MSEGQHEQQGTFGPAPLGVIAADWPGRGDSGIPLSLASERQRWTVHTNTIVVGVDGSQPSRAAVRWAAHRAERSHARLLLAHSLEEGAHAAHPDDGRRRSLREAGLERLETERRAAAAAAPSVTIGTELVVGDPVWAIAERYPGARVLVVGSHKTGFLRGAAFGGVSLQLAAASLAPVVVVPSFGDELGRGVVVGLDDSPDGRAALDAAIRLARDEHQELVLVRCVPLPRGDTGLGVAPVEAEAAAALARARQHVATIAPDLRMRSRILHGAPAPALVRAAARAMLLVVGRSQGTDLAASMGRVTHDVLLNMTVATAVVRAVPAPVLAR